MSNRATDKLSIPPIVQSSQFFVLSVPLKVSLYLKITVAGIAIAPPQTYHDRFVPSSNTQKRDVIQSVVKFFNGTENKVVDSKMIPFPRGIRSRDGNNPGR